MRSRQIFIATLLTLTTICFTLTFAGSTGQIKGKLTDKVTGEPVIGASVLVVGTTKGAQTDIDGNYQILRLDPGIYDLRVSSVEYNTDEIKGIVVTTDSTSIVNLQLSKKITDLDKVITVTAVRDVLDKKVLRNRKSNHQQAKKKRPVQNVDQILQQVAGVQRNPKGELFIRGGRASEVSYIIDGVSLCDPLRASDRSLSLQHGFEREAYERIYENQFLAVTANPLSTFSIDVDAASYSNSRRFINQNTLPPKDAVRIEEFINYFTYDYPEPEDDHPFSIVTELSDCPWNEKHRLLHIGLQGKHIDTDELPPSNIVFLLDVSGSMNSPNKLPLVQKSMHLLVNELRSIDRVAIVVYAGAAGLVLPSTTGDKKAEIKEAINRLSAGGSTAGGAGIKLAYKIAKENLIEDGNNRVILATDGDFNVGVSSDAEMTRLIEEKREDGIFITVLGFGMGNYQDSKLEKIADKGNGNYAYIDNLLEAKKTLVSEFGATLFTIAKDVKLQLEFNPVKVHAYRLIGYENRMLKKEDFDDDTKDAGEIGAGHSVTALYELIPAGENFEPKSFDSLKYQVMGITSEAVETSELLTIKFRYKEPDQDKSKLIVKTVMDDQMPLALTSNNFKFSSAVAQFGMLLRDSEFKGESSFKSVLEFAKSSKGSDEMGYRQEFIKLVETCDVLTQSLSKK